MISSIKIEGFRGVKVGQLEGLGPINILVGPNSSGKSTCLEAVALVGAASDARLAAVQLLKRGGPTHDALAHVVAPSAKRAQLKVGLPLAAEDTCGPGR